MKVCTFCLLLLSAACGAQQTPKPADSTNPLQLLERASRRYADAKSYHIEQIAETTLSTELSRDWQKKFVTVVVAPENRYRYAVRSQSGNRLRVSDGKTEWIYHVEENAYTRNPAPKDGPAVGPVLMSSTLEVFKATQLKKDLAGLAGNYASAESAPDEALDIGGRSIPCYVVRLGAGNSEKPLKPGSRIEETIWIAKDDFTIRKISSRRHLPDMTSPGVFQDIESTELYPVVELGGTMAESEFAFNPPANAAEVERFADPLALGRSLLGKTAPAVTFKSAAGAETALGSFRGKPVLLDFWATWCAPCVAAMPEMATIYQQTKEKGLVFISVDRDNEAQTATDYLANKREPWPNYHDDGNIGKAFEENGVPFTVLIDAKGKIVYSQLGYSDPSLTELREAIAALGPEYAAIKAPAGR